MRIKGLRRDLRPDGKISVHSGHGGTPRNQRAEGIDEVFEGVKVTGGKAEMRRKYTLHFCFSFFLYESFSFWRFMDLPWPG